MLTSRINSAFLILSPVHEDTKSHVNDISFVDSEFFCMKSEEYEGVVMNLFVVIFLVLMTTVRDLDFSIHGVQWHQRDVA